MLKEQVTAILLEHFNNGFVMGEIGVGDDQEATDKALEAILNLFKAEVDKLTVIDEDDFDRMGYDKDFATKSIIAEAQLQHTKKQLLEGLEG